MDIAKVFGSADIAQLYERNQEATIYVGNLDPKVNEDLLAELFVQCGPLKNVHIPRDKITSAHSGYGFIEYENEADADYAIKILNLIKLYNKPIRCNKASQDKRTEEVGANLFIGNLDPDVDEKLLCSTFSAFGTIISARIMRDQDTGESSGYGFVSYDSFESSDACLVTMNGQFLCNRPIHVSYAYKKDTKGERHGSAAERLIAANRPLDSRSKTLLNSTPNLTIPCLNSVPSTVGFSNFPNLPSMPPPPMLSGLGQPQMMPNISSANLSNFSSSSGATSSMPSVNMIGMGAYPPFMGSVPHPVMVHNVNTCMLSSPSSTSTSNDSARQNSENLNGNFNISQTTNSSETSQTGNQQNAVSGYNLNYSKNLPPLISAMHPLNNMRPIRFYPPFAPGDMHNIHPNFPPPVFYPSKSDNKGVNFSPGMPMLHVQGNMPSAAPPSVRPH